MRARSHNEADAHHGIDLAPMLDFVLNLLIFFIIITSFVKQSGVKVHKPDAVTGEHRDTGNIIIGIQPNGDMVAPAKVRVYGCDGGELQLTLLPKATHELKVYVNGRLALDTPISGDAWHGFVPAPKRTAHDSCLYTIVPQSLLGSTLIQFVRPSS